MLAGETLLAFDTLDDRREIVFLLRKLSPADRLAFIRWCCGRARLSGTSPDAGPEACPRLEMRDYRRKVEDARRCDRGDDRLTNTVYLDLLCLAHQYVFDLGAAVLELERRAKAI